VAHRDLRSATPIHPHGPLGPRLADPSVLDGTSWPSSAIRRWPTQWHPLVNAGPPGKSLGKVTGPLRNRQRHVWCICRIPVTPCG